MIDVHTHIDMYIHVCVATLDYRLSSWHTSGRLAGDGDPFLVFSGRELNDRAGSRIAMWRDSAWPVRSEC